MLRGLLVVFTVSGCSQLFGLDSPTTTTIDADSVDAELRDAAIPECLTLALRSGDDDDADMIADDQDTCIGQSGAQSDNDGDAIGAACDETARVDERFCVWTFRPPASGENAEVWTQAWDLSSSGWSLGASYVAHSGAPQYAETRGAYFSAPGGIAIDTFIKIDGYNAPFSAGGQLQTMVGSSVVAPLCQVSQPTSGTGRLELLNDGLLVDSYAFPALLPQQVQAYTRLAVIQSGAKTTLHCTIITSLLPTVQLTADVTQGSVEARPRLFAGNGNVSFNHVTVYKLGM